MAFDLGEALKSVSYQGTGREQIEYIRLDLIDGDEKNFYATEDIEALARNIAMVGLLDPLRIRDNPESVGRYMVVSGHRRRLALKLLEQDDPAQWGEVACIHEATAVSPTLQQLRLIFANSDTRKMKDADISEQAAQVKDLLYKLKVEEGYDFPGRMRDHVAEIVKISKSKLARLEVIRKDLAAVWQPAWKNGTLAENTAYELSKMPKAYQTLLFEEKTRTNANIKCLYTNDVKKFAERCNSIVKMGCKIFGGDCGNYENKLRKAAVSDRYGWFHCDAKCCRDCPELTRCQRACPRLADTIKKIKADAKEAAKQEKLAREEKDRPAVEQISALWQRFGLCREAAYKDIDACKSAMNIHCFPFDEENTMKLECGEAKIAPTTKLPYGMGCYLTEIKRLISCADLFGVSLDYLLCRTDTRKMATEAVSKLDTESKASKQIMSAWYPASVEPPVGKKLVILDQYKLTDEGIYQGDGLFTGRIDDQDPIWAWALMPTDEDLVASSKLKHMPESFWHSGSPDAYGTYVAYVKVAGAAHPMLRELLWDGEEWFMFGEKISTDVTIQCWTDRPDL